MAPDPVTRDGYETGKQELVANAHATLGGSAMGLAADALPLRAALPRMRGRCTCGPPQGLLPS